MRLALLAAVVFLSGTGAAGVKLGFIPVPGQAMQAWEQLRDAGFNPVRAAYNYVAAQIATPRTPESLGFHPSVVPPADFTAMQQLVARPPPMMSSGFGANIAS